MVTKRLPSLKVAVRNNELVEKIKALKQNHPFWGYRRIWANLNYHTSLLVNRKRIYRLMQQQNLLVKEHRKLKDKRKVYPSKPKAHRPNQIWGTDMTKVKLPHIGWAYIVLVLDWNSKKIVGHSIALRSKTADWLDALNVACQQQFPQGIQSYQNLSLVSDNGCQPTSARYIRECSVLGIKQIFTSFCNPKGNADTERLMRTMKEELIWSNDWMSYGQLSAALDHWVHAYNTQYLHSALGYIPPSVYEKKYLDQQVTSPLKVA